MSHVEFLDAPHGPRLAYCKTDGAGPTVVFLGGFMSDMTGSKATALETHCRTQGRAFLRFDYSGHGQSSGAFRDGTIGDWATDMLAVLGAVTEGPLLLVGSSMGGWMMLLATRMRPARVAGLIGIAAAPDFTEKLMWRDFDDATRAEIMTEGFIQMDWEYEGDPYVITRALIEDGRKQQLLDNPIEFNGPVRLLHGQKDEDVPWEWSLEIAEALTGDDVEVTLVKDGDHRLSTDADIARLLRTVDEVTAKLC